MAVFIKTLPFQTRFLDLQYFSTKCSPQTAAEDNDSQKPCRESGAESYQEE